MKDTNKVMSTILAVLISIAFLVTFVFIAKHRSGFDLLSKGNNESSTSAIQEESPKFKKTEASSFTENGISFEAQDIMIREDKEQISVLYKVKNNTGKDVILSVQSVDCNGFSFYACADALDMGSEKMGTNVYETIGSGKEVVGYIGILKSYYDFIGFDCLEYMKFNVNIADMESNAICSKTVCVETDKNGKSKETLTFNGEIVYEDEKVKVGYKKYMDDFEVPFIIFIENKTDYSLDYWFDGIRMNDTSFGMASTPCYVRMMPHTSYVSPYGFTTLFVAFDKPEFEQTNTMQMYITFFPYDQEGNYINDTFETSVFTMHLNR